MLFVTNDANCSSYTHHIKELFCLPKEKDSQLDFNDRYYTRAIKSSQTEGKKRKRLQLNISLLVSIQYP